MIEEIDVIEEIEEKIWLSVGRGPWQTGKTVDCRKDG